MGRRKYDIPDIDDNDPEVRVRRAISAMPFGGGIDRSWDPRDKNPLSEEPLTLEHVAMYLERLQARLREHVKDFEAKEEELRDFRQALSGVAYLLNRAGKMRTGT